MRRRKQADSQNLDSLLDTMANVVGVLVVLMAVTQLTVNDAMKRIRVWESDEALGVAGERAEAETRLAALGPSSLAEALEIDRMREHLRKLREDPDASRLRKVDSATVQADAASSRLRVRRLEAEVADKKEQLARLSIRLEGVEAQPEQTGVDVRLPDPRPAPPNSSRVVFLCRYERVLDPELERLEAEFTEVAKQALGLGRVGAGSLPMLSRYFQNHDVGNRFLRWRILAPEPLARLDWRSREAGESRVQLRDPGASFRAALRGYDPRLHHLRFFVWGDSFEIYLDARSIAEDMGFQVGWKPFEAREQLIFALGGRDYRAPAPVD